MKKQNTRLTAQAAKQIRGGVKTAVSAGSQSDAQKT